MALDPDGSRRVETGVAIDKNFFDLLFRGVRIQVVSI
jgi:hypothetical protein